MTKTTTNYENVTKPLYATVGAGDAIFAAVVDAVGQVRGRADNVSTDVTSRVESAREQFAKLPADVQSQIHSLRERLAELPSDLPSDLRGRLTPEELRKSADTYLKAALDFYNDLASRGAETVDKLRANPAVEGRIERAEGLYNEAVSLAEEAIDKVTVQAKALADLVNGKASEVSDEVKETVEAEVATVKTKAKKVKADIEE